MVVSVLRPAGPVGSKEKFRLAGLGGLALRMGPVLAMESALEMKSALGIGRVCPVLRWRTVQIELVASVELFGQRSRCRRFV